MSRTPRGRCLIGCAGPIHTFPLTMFLLIESFVLKRAQLVQAGSLLSEWDTFRAWRPDIFFFVAVALAFSVLISATGGKLRIVLSAVFHAFAGLSGLFLILNHYYYSSQGTTLGLGIARYALRNFGDNRELYASEAHPGRIAVLGLQLAAIVLSIIIINLRPVKDWISKNSCSRKRTAAALYLVAAIALEGYSFVPALRDVHPALTQNPVRELAAEMFRSGRPAQDVPLIPESERMDAPLELVKDPSVPNYNVVLIIFESINWKNTDIFTPGLGTTPFLAELAKKGAVVERMYTVVPHTTKALVSLIGGFYPYLDSEIKEAIPDILPRKSLAHILRRHGYRTAFFQTANHYEQRPQLVANLGYAVFKGVYDMPSRGFEDTNYFGKEERMMIGPSLDWVESVRDNPFFLTYLTLCTHHDYSTPASFERKVLDPLDPVRNKYLNAVSYIDGFIREVISAFEKRRMTDNTLFLIVGDHGEAFGEHDMKGHNFVMWEEGLRTVGVLYAPGRLTGGTTIKGYRSILDIPPTVCDFVGLKPRIGSFCGTSLFQPVAEDRVLYFSGWLSRRGSALRRGRTKSIYHPAGNRIIAFDNETDPLDLDALPLSRSGVMVPPERDKAEIMGWVSGINAQYSEWERSRASAPKRTSFEIKAQAHFEDLLSLVSYEINPVRVKRGWYVIMELELRSEKVVHRPLEPVVILTDGKGRELVVPISLKDQRGLDSLKPGRSIGQEFFLDIPIDWPLGDALVLFGIRDVRSRQLISVTKAAKDIEKNDRRILISRITVVE